jgi:hypothetical protein
MKILSSIAGALPVEMALAAAFLLFGELGDGIERAFIHTLDKFVLEVDDFTFA